MKKSKQLSISQLISMFFGLMIALVILSYTLITFSNNSLRTNARIIDKTKEMERSVKQIAYLNALVKDGNREAKIDLKTYQDKVDDIVDILKNGREKIAIQTNVGDIAPVSGKVREKVLLFGDNWKRYKKELNILLSENAELDSVVDSKQPTKADEIIAEGDSSQANFTIIQDIKTVEKVRNSKVQKAYEALNEANPRLQKNISEISDLFISNYINTQTTIQVILFFVILILLVTLVAGYFLIIRNLITPLNKVAKITREIADGDVTQKVLYDRRDELGQLSNNINSLVTSLKQTSEFAKNMGNANYEYPFAVRGDKDTLGYALLDMKDNLLKVAEDDRRRNWSNNGFNEFVDILRTRSEDLEALSYRVISNLVNYLKANQGGIFIMQEENGEQFLEMKASFAYDKKKFQEKRIGIGQGLIGQAVVERDILHIDKIPEDYIQVTSGLGDATPKNLLIIPLIDNNEVYGAIEIASFNRFEKYEIDFVEKLSENIASTLAGARNVTRNQKLLLDSQQATESMKVQDDLMRQNMEELASTQEVMQKSQVELQRMKDNLEVQIEERTSELAEKESQLSEALRLADLAPWKLVINKNMFECNNEFFRLLRTNSEIEQGFYISVERFINDFTHIDDRTKLQKKLAEAVRADIDYEESIEFRILPMGSEYRNVSLSIKQTREENDNSLQFLYGTMQDITKQKRIEEQIRLKNEELELQQLEQQKFVTMVENATDFVFMANIDQQIIYSNKIGQQNFGVVPYEANKIFIKDLLRKEDFETFKNEILPQVLSSGMWEGELEMVNLYTKQLTYMTGNIVSIKDNKGEYTAIATIMRDITDKRRIAQEMETSNIRMKSILESTEDEILAIDIDFNLLSFNTQWANFIFKEAGIMPVVGMNLLKDLGLRPELCTKYQIGWERVFEDGSYSDVETFTQKEVQKVKSNGREKDKEIVLGEYYFSRFYNPIYSTDGHITGGVLFTKNITEQQMAEQAILKSENRLKAITNSTTEGIIIHEKGYIKDVNSAFCIISGYTADELIGSYIFNLLTPESKAVAIINMQLGYEKPYEATFINKKGFEIPTEILGRVVRFEDQRVRVFAIRNLTEQFEAQRKLQNAKDMLQKIIDALPQSVFWKDAESKFLGGNQKFLQNIGLEKSDQLIGKSDFDLYVEDEAKEYIEQEQRMIATNMPEIDVLQTQKQISTDKTAWLKVSKVPFHDSEGVILGIIGTYQDITDEKNNEELIRENKDRLRKHIEQLTMLGAQNITIETLPTFAGQITEIICENLNLGRASIWHLVDDNLNEGHLQCLDIFDSNINEHLQHESFAVQKFPIFIAELNEKPVILAEYAQVDARIKELTVPYLAEAGITSLLCYPIKLENKLKGIIMCEHTRTPREWTQDNQKFALSMLDLMTAKIKDAESQEIISSYTEISTKIKEEEREERVATHVENLTNNVVDSVADNIAYQIMEKSIDSIVSIDKNGNISYFNSKAQTILEGTYNKDIFKNMNWFDLFAAFPEELEKQRMTWEQLYMEQEAFEKVVYYGQGDFKYRARTYYEPVKDKSGIFAGVIIYIRKSA